jgi:hypothetical protein
MRRGRRKEERGGGGRRRKKRRWKRKRTGRRRRRKINEKMMEEEKEGKYCNTDVSPPTLLSYNFLLFSQNSLPASSNTILITSFQGLCCVAMETKMMFIFSEIMLCPDSRIQMKFLCL